MYLIANVADSAGVANQPVHQFLEIYQNFLPGWLLSEDKGWLSPYPVYSGGRLIEGARVRNIFEEPDLLAARTVTSTWRSRFGTMTSSVVMGTICSAHSKSR